jgi:uncharacterized protein (TIGR00730 family)
MKRILVFCGSSSGRLPEYRDAAVALGRLLAERGLGLVYGGAKIGLMGAVADATLAAGGEVIGVIPRRLVELEVAHRGLTELHVVGTMHERKALMAEMSDGVIALPGGIGTLDELFELFTWSQLGLHRAPLGVLDVAGFWTPLQALLDHLVREGFLRGAHRDTLLVEIDASALLDRMAGYRYVPSVKWVDRG